MPYNKEDFTYGFEIEWGDISRDVRIPERLGSWDYSECDIINLHEPYRYIAADPLGIEPPVGGEINTKPTRTWQEQIDRIMEIQQIFLDVGDKPTSNCLSHSHVHVRVPGLTDDINALKRLIRYIRRNQELTVERCHQFKPHKHMKGLKNCTNYMKFDGGRLMPEWMCDNIETLATDFDSFIKLHAAGKDGVSMGRPFRYAINTYSLKHMDTIEFRLFRSTTKREELESVFRFVELFIDAALNDGPDVEEILETHEFQFPPFVFKVAEYKGWLATKYDKERGSKARVLHEVV